MSNRIESHVYDRAVVAGADDALGRILAHIPAGSTILDVGTGSGTLGRYLAENKNCITDGLTDNPEEQRAARPHYRNLHLADLEHQKPSEVIVTQSYDRIVCADVLEHLRNADMVLADLAKLLTPDGRILVSVPNATYLGVIACLIAGHLTRTREGLLDHTHVRFFDRPALDELARAAGLHIEAIERVIRNPVETEFRKIDFDAIPPAILHYLQARPEALTYEFVIELSRTPDEAHPPRRGSDLPAYASPAIKPCFMAQAFFDFGQGFCEKESSYSFGDLGGTRTCLKFPVPRHTDAALNGLMIDLTDRPGSFELFSLQIEDKDGNAIWQWPNNWQGSFLFRDLEMQPLRGPSGGHLLIANTAQPRMQLSFTSPLSQAAYLLIDMTGPLQYEAAAFHQAQQQTTETLTRLQQFFETNQSSLHQRLHSTAEENLSLHRLLQCATDEKQTLSNAVKMLETLVEEQRKKITQLELITASPLHKLHQWLKLKTHGTRHARNE